MQNKKALKIFLNFIPAILVMVLIFYFSSKTGSESDKQSDPFVYFLSGFSSSFSIHTLILIVRKSGHFLEYTLLGSTLVFGFNRSFHYKNKKTSLLTIFTGLFYALLDEFHQLFVPERSGNLKDVGIDLLGIVFGIVLMLSLLKILNLRNKKYPDR